MARVQEMSEMIAQRMLKPLLPLWAVSAGFASAVQLYLIAARPVSAKGQP
jgi:hypothetical protein